MRNLTDRIFFWLVFEGGVIWVALILKVTFWMVVGYVAAHFLMKYW